MRDGRLSLESGSLSTSSSFVFTCTAALMRFMHAKRCTRCADIILYGSGISPTSMHYPAVCFHSLAGVVCVSEATAGAESLMNGVQGSWTSAVVELATTQ